MICPRHPGTIPTPRAIISYFAPLPVLSRPRSPPNLPRNKLHSQTISLLMGPYKFFSLGLATFAAQRKRIQRTNFKFRNFNHLVKSASSSSSIRNKKTFGGTCGHNGAEWLISNTIMLKRQDLLALAMLSLTDISSSRQSRLEKWPPDRWRWWPQLYLRGLFPPAVRREKKGSKIFTTIIIALYILHHD